MKVGACVRSGEGELTTLPGIQRLPDNRRKGMDRQTGPESGGFCTSDSGTAFSQVGNRDVLTISGQGMTKFRGCA